MTFKTKQGTHNATVALAVVMAVAHQHINGVQCFMPSKSSFYQRGLQRLSLNTRPRVLHYRVGGDNQTEHQTTSSRTKDVIIEIQNHNTTRDDDIEENQNPSNIVCEQKLNYVGAGTLGDIMSYPSQDDDNDDTIDPRGNGSLVGTLSTTPIDEDDQVVLNLKKKNGMEDKHPTKSGLVTSTGGTLTSEYGQKVPNLSPLDRIALTANGNLQRIFSSFYDAPVHVHVEQCIKRASHATAGRGGRSMDEGLGEDAVWDRVVHLSVFDQNFCKATSAITVHSQNCVKIIESGELGIGQLFRFLDKLPTFTIVDAGRCENGGLWRSYKLECEELSCEILEEFVPNAWQLQPEGTDYFDGIDGRF